MPKTRSILLIDDREEDFEAIRWIWQKAEIAAPLVRSMGGEDALNRLLHKERYANLRAADDPALVLMDLNLTGMDGFSVLTAMRANAALRTLPVVILTSSANPKDVETCYRNGANSYVLKTNDLNESVEILRKVVSYWMELVLLPPAPKELCRITTIGY
jgi:CheY-like chemotaxis protein